MSETETKALGDAVQATLVENQKTLKESLGETDYAKFDAFEKTEPYRQSIGSIANAMRSKGVEITGDLQESLLSAYGRAIQESTDAANNTAVSSLTEAQRLELKKQQMQAFRVRLLKQMSGVLDEHQLQIFMETELEQQNSPGP